MVKGRDIVRLKVVDFQEVEPTLFVLDEITNELIYSALFHRVDICLGEDFVDCSYSFDGTWVRVGHAFDLDCV